MDYQEKDQLGMESRKVVLLSTIYSCRRTHFTCVVKTISSGLSRPNASFRTDFNFDNWFLLPPSECTPILRLLLLVG